VGRRRKTSITVDEELWRQAKHLAVDEGRDVSEVVEEALRRHLAERGYWPPRRG